MRGRRHLYAGGVTVSVYLEKGEGEEEKILGCGEDEYLQPRGSKNWDSSKAREGPNQTLRDIVLV